MKCAARFTQGCSRTQQQHLQQTRDMGKRPTARNNMRSVSINWVFFCNPVGETQAIEVKLLSGDVSLIAFWFAELMGKDPHLEGNC